jgi:hypothetical protein
MRCTTLMPRTHNASAIKCPMTAPPNSLSTHDCGPTLSGDSEKFGQAFGKLRACDVVCIAAKRGVAPRDVRGIRPWPATSAERDDPMIGNAVLDKCTAQRGLRELRLPP